MPRKTTPPEAWVDEATRVLATSGPDAVRVEAVASRLGVTKGGFYWHFADRGALLERVLDDWEHALVDDIITQVDSDATEPSARLRRLFELANQFAKSEHGPALELAIREWARRDKSVAKRLRRALLGRPHTVVVDVPYQRDDGLEDAERGEPREIAATETGR